MSFQRGLRRAPMPARDRAVVWAVGRRVSVTSTEGFPARVGLMTEDGNASRVSLANGAEVEVVGWRPSGSRGVRYQVRATDGGLEGWVAAGSLRDPAAAASPAVVATEQPAASMHRRSGAAVRPALTIPRRCDFRARRCPCYTAACRSRSSTTTMSRFPVRVGTTFVESMPAWPVPRRAPEGAPNVVLVVLDDVGFAQLGCFGSDIDTPSFDRLAAEGLRYRSFHTTAMCSPTRACLLTGRNPHTCAMGGITDLAMGFPGYHGRIPRSCGFVPEVLRQAGWATFAVGKWHLAPSDEKHAAAPRDRWPLGQGFERYYGFLGGETNQFAPDLVIDNTPLRFAPPAGYHLTEDLIDRAIGLVTDLRTADPDKPFFLYLALGACHAPHQAPPEWIERYRGRFDDGWDVWRARTLARQIALGIVPPGTALSSRPSWVQEWASLPAEERAAYARMMEVYAGFLSHTDHHLGRLLDFLAESGELDRTLVVALSDNGASAEGGPHGTFNENFIFNGLPHDVEATRAMLDELGGPETYGHYPWGWAHAGNTPFRRWKRETHEGGIGDPLIVRWPATPDRGAVRPQYAHAIDVPATILDLAGAAMPDGAARRPAGAARGAELRRVATGRRRARAPRDAVLRAVRLPRDLPPGLEGGHVPRDAGRPVHRRRTIRIVPSTRTAGSSTTWRRIPAESQDLAAAEPERLRALQELWWREAGRYGALPLQSRRIFALGRPHRRARSASAWCCGRARRRCPRSWRPT